MIVKNQLTPNLITIMEGIGALTRQSVKAATLASDRQEELSKQASKATSLASTRHEEVLNLLEAAHNDNCRLLRRVTSLEERLEYSEGRRAPVRQPPPSRSRSPTLSQEQDRYIPQIQDFRDLDPSRLSRVDHRYNSAPMQYDPPRCPHGSRLSRR